MTRYLLDTDALIDFSKGVEPATSLILSWIDSSDLVAICPISVAEFYAGLTQKQASSWERLITSLPYWNISRGAAMQAGQYLYAFTREGKRVSITDMLLVAVAQEHEATLVTGNVNDFPMEGLTILSTR